MLQSSGRAGVGLRRRGLRRDRRRRRRRGGKGVRQTRRGGRSLVLRGDHGVVSAVAVAAVAAKAVVRCCHGGHVCVMRVGVVHHREVGVAGGGRVVRVEVGQHHVGGLINHSIRPAVRSLGAAPLFWGAG